MDFGPAFEQFSTEFKLALAQIYCSTTQCYNMVNLFTVWTGYFRALFNVRIKESHMLSLCVVYLTFFYLTFNLIDETKKINHSITASISQVCSVKSYLLSANLKHSLFTCQKGVAVCPCQALRHKMTEK